MTNGNPIPSERVLIIVENLPVPFDRRVWSEARTLKDAGYEVSIVCPTGKDAQLRFEKIEGIEIYRHPMPLEANGALGYVLEYTAALFWELVLSTRIFARHRIDVIHACNPPDLIFVVGSIFKFFFGTKFVFDHHDINPELYEAKFGRKGFFWRLLVILEKLTFKLADISIATNNSYRDIAIERGGMDPEKVFVVRSGPDLTRVKCLPPQAIWKNQRKFLVAYVGVIGSQEGLDLLLQSVAFIKNVAKRSDIQFVIVGGGPDLPRTKQLAQSLGLDDFVTFTDRVSDATLLEILSTAEVCVNPDRPNTMNDKSTMNKIMEYMALGKPIVQFDLTEGRYSAEEASLYAANTDIVDFAQKIIALLDDPERRRIMGEFGKARVTEVLSWANEAPKLLAAYAAVLKAH